MGFYIQTPGYVHGKAQRLIDIHGARRITQPDDFSVIKEDEALVVVLDNGLFEAAGVPYSQEEFESFTLPNDTRPKEFLLMDRATAYKLAGIDKG